MILLMILIKCHISTGGIVDKDFKTSTFITVKYKITMQKNKTFTSYHNNSNIVYENTNFLK